MTTEVIVAPPAASSSEGQLATSTRLLGSSPIRAAGAAEPIRSAQTQYQGAPGEAVTLSAALRKVNRITAAQDQATLAGVTAVRSRRKAPSTGAEVCTRFRTMRSPVSRHHEGEEKSMVTGWRD